MPSQRSVWFSSLLLLASCSHVESLQPSRPFTGRNPRAAFVVQQQAPFPVCMAASSSEEDDTDAISQSSPPAGDDEKKMERGDLLRDAIRRLAELSLEDYRWRSSGLKSSEADRMVEQSMARMLGEDAAYVRPMDASDNSIGPLGKLEKTVNEWFSKVIDEEGRRAERIVNSDGQLIRPIDAGEEDMGPLAFLEQRVIDFFQSILNSEKERVRTGTLRPKDLEETVRGPFGELELRVVFFLREVEQSERLRLEQSRLRGGQIVRPIDVPGPLGEIEMAISEIFYAEEKRAKENPGKFIRPKDARVPGPFGEAELSVGKVLENLRKEESDRLRNIKRVMQDNRPMDADSDSFLGVFETIIVGIARGPQLFASVFKRVQELLSSEPLDESDMEIVKDGRKMKPSSLSRKNDDAEA
jgi:hypothetical protein